MKIGVSFSESDQVIVPVFGEVHNMSDGGYERGYSAGYDVGYADGEATAEVDVARFASELRFGDWALFGGETAKVTIYNQTSWANMFNTSKDKQNTTLRHLTVTSDVQPTSMYGLFRHAAHNDNFLKQITLNVDTSKCTDFGYCFAGMRALEVIDGTPLDFSAMLTSDSYTFYVCTNLIEVRIKPQTIYKSISFVTCHALSSASVRSIVDGLADLTGETSQTATFSQSQAVRAALKEFEDIIAAKNWVLA